jgi:lipopolysaccharide export LptBFGC system permease protein LptF
VALLSTAISHLTESTLVSIDGTARRQINFMMSLIYGLVLIAIAWVVSTLIGGLTEIGTLLGSLPTWLTLIALSAAIAWLVSDP